MGHITINELSEELKNQINSSGMKEEDVNNLIQSKIGTNELSTTNKTITGAINERFQSANNGKELIANAIGEPLNSNDTFSAMSNDINGLLSTLKTNMMNVGIAVESGDRFKQLIDKIATMAGEGGNTGVQFAEGTVTVFLDETDWDEKAIVNDLSFKPSIVILNNALTSYVCNTLNDSCYISSSSSTGVSGKCSSYMTTSSNGFTINAGFFSANSVVNYYAIGIGEEDTTLRDSLASILENKGVDVTEEDDMATLIEYINKCSFDADVVNMGGNTVNLKSSTTGKYIFNHSIGHTNYKFNYDITGSYSYTTDTTKYASVPFEGNLGMSDITKTLTHTKSFNMWASDNYGSLDTTITITKYNDKVEFDFTIKNNSKNVVINVLEYVISSSIIIYMK